MRPPRRIPALSCALFLCLLGKIDAVIYSGAKDQNSGWGHLGPNFTIQKVSMTQKGYIQFLKYATKVPILTDYTFCIWVRSNNLTYNHPLLSYSKHEDERLIRVWISEQGEDLCLEILDHFIFRVKVNIKEHIWYHVCQSWSAQQGSWDLFLNGKLKSSGYVPKLRGVPIEGDGDIVVGQEYTDFDKGLDDGIEGDVSGFNFVLSSTFSGRPSNSISFPKLSSRRHLDGNKGRQPLLYPVKPLNIYQPPSLTLNTPVGGSLISVDKGFNVGEIFTVNPRQFSGHFTRKRTARSIFKDMINLFDAELRTPTHPYKFYAKVPIHGYALTSRRTSNEIVYEGGSKSLGLLLVKLSFDCGFKKGAPLSGRKVLISWTKTPVRVFGGAILKQVPPFCRTI